MEMISFLFVEADRDLHVCYNNTQISPLSYKCPSLPRPGMVPTVLGRGVGLYSRVLDWHAVPNTLLLHSDPVQLAHLVAFCLALAELESLLRGQTLVVDETERLARRCHAVVLPFEIELVLHALLGLVELPCAVDRPVAEGTVTGNIIVSHLRHSRLGYISVVAYREKRRGRGVRGCCKWYLIWAADYC